MIIQPQKLTRHLLPFAFLGLAFMGVIYASNSVAFHTDFDFANEAISIDLVLTIPLIYFLLIRETSIPNTTTIPVLIGSIFLGDAILPETDHSILRNVKTYVVPAIEISVFGFVVYKIRQLRKQFKDEASGDFFDNILEVTKANFPKRMATLLSTELAIVYYSFIKWKKAAATTNSFSHHKNTGTIGLLSVIIFLVGIECVALHILLAKWSVIAAWTLTILSIYSGLQILGIVKSLIHRTSTIDESHLHLRYGILSQASIPLNTIQTVSLYKNEIDKASTIVKLSPLGELESHNILIELNQTQKLAKLYGFEKEFTQLALHVDTPEEFINQLTS